MKSVFWRQTLLPMAFLVALTCAGPATQSFASGSNAAALGVSVIGVSDGGNVSGTLTIQAIASGGRANQAVFTLESANHAPLSYTDRQAPFFFQGDSNGQPKGWDSTSWPDGPAMLTVKLTGRNGQQASTMVHVTVANGTQPQPTTAPTSAPQPTPTTPPNSDMTGICGESSHEWHAPVVTGADGKPCATGHEHGDAPPAWIAAAGYQVMFHGHFNTSPAENTAKHAAMKGFAATLKGVDLYFRIHAASNPLDRSARYHSYEIWARDPSGGVSHWQGWYNAGDPVKDRFPRRKVNGDPGTRPIMLVVDQQSINEGITCEQWYSAPAQPGWGWDFGWTMCGATTLYQPNENATASDLSTWVKTGSLGGTRRLEAAWYASRQHPTGAFVATQFGEIVSGMNDPRCSATTVKYGVTYQNVCLDQYIAPTMTEVSFPDNAVQKTFDTTGVSIPN